MVRKIKNSFQKFFQIEAASSIILGFATILALIIANSNAATNYHNILEFKFFSLTLSHWINDGLMAIFFFLIGLEIKKELVEGELNSLKKASLPLAAALGGMVVPALIYATLNPLPPAHHGWGIPMATDIAFAAGVLSLFGKRVPASLKVLLLALAIVDDLGAIIVIALFYTSQIKWLGLIMALIGVILLQIFKKLKVCRYLYYTPIGLFIWLGVLYSGVHATIAGVVVGLLTPLQFKTQNHEPIYPVKTLIHFLHVPVSFIIMPIFALANAGVSLSLESLNTAFTTPVFWGVGLGLVLGKPIGVFLLSYLSCFFKFSVLPPSLKWRHILVLGNFAGIGFTMSLFISKLALPAELEAYSKVGILIASFFAILISVLSFMILIPKEKNY